MNAESEAASPKPRKNKVVYALSDAGLTIEPGRTLDLADIVEVRTYDVPAWHLANRIAIARRQRCVIRPKHGSPVLIGSEDALRLSGGDADAPYDAFIEALLLRMPRANPKAVLEHGMPLALWWIWMVLLLASLIVAALAISVVGGNAEVGQLESKQSLAAIVFLIVLLFLIVPVARLLPYSRPRRIDPGRR